MATQTAAQIAESYDYFNPFVAAKIITKDGTEYPLWSGQSASTVGFDIKTALPEEWGSLRALSFLTEVSVENNLGQLPTITITLRPPFQEFVKLINTDLLELGNTRLQVQLGYARSKSGQPVLQAFEGMLCQPPEFSIGAECSLTLKALGANGSYISQIRQGATTYENMTRSDILKQVAGKHGWVFSYDADTQKDDISGPALFSEKVTRCQGWQSTLFFITQLLNEARCYMVFGGLDSQGAQIISVFSRTAMLAKKKPQYILSIFGYKEHELLGYNVFPILTMQTSGNPIFLPGVQQIVMREVDAKKKSVQTQTIDAASAKFGQTTPGAIDGKADTANNKFMPSVTPTDGARHIPGDPADASALALGKEAFDKYSLAFAIPADVETIGMPQIQCGSLVALRGLGPKLDLNYCVFKLNHVAGSTGFTTKLHLISNTQTELEKALRDLRTGTQNMNAPQEGGGETTTKQPQAG